MELRKKYGDNKWKDYAAFPPRMEYPKPKLNPDGTLSYLKPGQKESDLSETQRLGMPVKVDATKYSAYNNAVTSANRKLAEDYAGQAFVKTKYGSTNINARAMLEKMQQVVNDPIILGQSTEAFKDNPLFNDPNMPNPKFDRLMDIINHHDKQPLDVDIVKSYTMEKDSEKKAAFKRRARDTRGKKIIFCNSVQTMSALKRRLEAAGHGDRVLVYAGSQRVDEFANDDMPERGKKLQQKVLDVFKDPKHAHKDILIANSAAETGLNIPEANLVVNYEMPWNPKAMAQRIDRAHRIGSQPREVTAYNLAVEGTVDERKLRAHAFKDILFQSMIERQKDAQDQREQFIKISGDKVSDDPVAIMQEMVNKYSDLSFDKASAERKAIMQKNKQSSAQANAKVNPAKKAGLVSRMFGW